MERNDAPFRREGYLNEDYHFFHLRDTAGQERSFHYHDFDKLVLLLDGSVDYAVEDTVCPLRPWDVLLVRHHVIHKALIDLSAPYERVIVYLDRRFFERTAPGAGLMDCFDRADAGGLCRLTPDAAERETLRRDLALCEEALADDGFGAAALRDGALLRLMAHIGRLRPSGGGAQPAPELPPCDEKIRAALSYINEHLTEPLSVEELAARVYLSKYHFMRLFKAQTGTTVHACLRQKRLLYAARLIREGTPAGQAASRCGFADYSAFSRAFTACFGVRPSDLRQHRTTLGT